jgi:FMN phosphatase YigB (HAD superfamily)
MTGRDIDLVIFDLGRVLIRICDGWDGACLRAGVPRPSCLDDPGVTARVHALSEEHEKGRIDTDAFCEQAAEVVGLTPAQVRAVSDAWLQGAFDGVEALINDLAARAVRMACLSNTNDNHWRMITAASASSADVNRLPLHKLDWRFASHLIGLMKPDPAIYRHVERVTAVAASGILFFDDHSPNIEAARARGWRAERILAADHGGPVAQMRRFLGGYGLL